MSLRNSASRWTLWKTLAYSLIWILASLRTSSTYLATSPLRHTLIICQFLPLMTLLQGSSFSVPPQEVLELNLRFIQRLWFTAQCATIEKTFHIFDKDVCLKMIFADKDLETKTRDHHPKMYPRSIRQVPTKYTPIAIKTCIHCFHKAVKQHLPTHMYYPTFIPTSQDSSKSYTMTPTFWL